MRRKSRERASEGDDDDAARNMMEYEPFDPESAVPRNRKLTLLKIAALLAIGFLIFVSIRGITSSSGSTTNNLQGLAEDKGPFHAYVQLRVGKTEAKMGTLLLVQQAAGEPVTVTGKITGLSPNAKHGFHVHVFGDFRNGCESVGPHFNPFNKVHGAPTDQERHVGDLGNVETNSSGTANVEITDTLIALAPGPTSIIGRSFVVHSGTDDLGKGNFEDSLTTGHAGVKYGCGVVAITSN